MNDMPNQSQRTATDAVHQGRAALEIARQLCEHESSALWIKWAEAKSQAGEHAEAEAGFECALRLDPDNPNAAARLTEILEATNRTANAMEIRRKAGLTSPGTALDRETRPSLEALDDYLRRFVRLEENEEDYFLTHLSRYLATLQMIPTGEAHQSLLELGAAFHHITPALKNFLGYGTIHCADYWLGEPFAFRTLTSLDGKEEHRFPVSNFDIESAPWPYPAEQFDIVLCCEILEHLILDPMLVLSEINRLLKPGGRVLLTTPNIASGKGIRSLFEGESPYVWSQFEPHGLPTDRHNREYSVAEVLRLLSFAGFASEAVNTPTFYWPVETSFLARLAAMEIPIGRRGDDLMVLASKQRPVQDRYPAEFYATQGTQQKRREGEGRQDNSGMRPMRILVAHEILPEYDRTGCDQRLMQVLTELRSMGHEVTYVARSGQGSERYQPVLEELGIRVYAHDSERMRFLGLERESGWRFDQVLNEGKFDVAILYHWYWNGISIPEHYLFDIRRHSPRTRILVLTDDQHGLREQRLAEISQAIPDIERAEDFLQRELEVYREADMVLMVSEEDRKGLLRRLPSMKTEILPNDAESLSGSAKPSAEVPFHERRDILFLGNFDNLANRDALQWFLDEVWPLIRVELPGVRLVLAGNNMPEPYRNLAPDIQGLGYVEDLGQLFSQHRVFAAPVRYGTGTKTKNLNALSHGLPIVTTTVGAEGLELVHENNALIADSETDFAAQIVRLYRDEPLWNQLSRQGQSHIHATFGRQRLRSQIEKILLYSRILRPRPYEARKQFSFLRVEGEFPEVLARKPAWERTEVRLLGYLKIAERLLAGGNIDDSLEQLRHIFTFVRGELPSNSFSVRVLNALEQAYAAVGNDRMREKYQQAHLRLFLPNPKPSVPAIATPSMAKPSISVVIPTRNRWMTLARCLRALNEQTLPPEDFEVVVVDDGSTDETESYCKLVRAFAHFHYLKQEHQGTGAARNRGVKSAHGKYVLLINDDSIAAPDLLALHRDAHLRHADSHLAILGNFSYPATVKRRALTYFLATQPLIFPQVGMKAGYYNKNAYYITCNLSLQRDEVLAAGNFDPDFRVAEDTELGVRLRQRGGRLYYEPRCMAIHDHAEYPLADLINRSRRYGAAQCQLIQKHPRLLLEHGVWPAPLLTTGMISDLDDYLETKRGEAATAVASLERFDTIDFEPYFSMNEGPLTMADQILMAFSKLIPVITDYYLTEGFREACRERNLKCLAVETIK